MPAVYGYCRISRKVQNVERQIRNIKEFAPNAVIVQEAYSGRTLDRPQWKKLLDKVKPGDTIVFDSVSRMSRNAADGIEIYMRLFDNNVSLVFLKERFIDTDTYRQALQNGIESVGNDIADIYIKATNEVLKLLAKRQIQHAFEQSQKEVDDLRQRTSEGLKTAQLNGKRVGTESGRKLNVKKAEPAKALILKYSKDFDGTLSDVDCLKLVNISRNTYYRYKRELRERQNNSPKA